MLAISSQAIAQVTISPTAVFLDNNSKVGNFYVSNPSQSAVEVRLSFEFAYPATNEDGRVSLNYNDTEAEENFALDPYLRSHYFCTTAKPATNHSFGRTFAQQLSPRNVLDTNAGLIQSANPSYW